VQFFLNKHYCGVKKIALRVESVPDAFDRAIRGGAFPVRFPARTEDEYGSIEEASIEFLGDTEIVFIDRKNYTGVFKPGFKPSVQRKSGSGHLLRSIDHMASEVRVNESRYWTNYLQKAIGTELVQSIGAGDNNSTGMILNISQNFNRKLTFVISEPEPGNRKSKVQENIDMFGPGVHHLAFSTDDIFNAVKEMSAMNVDFVSFPNTYYDLIRTRPEFDRVDLGALQEHGILIDIEGDGCLMQKFIKPITERPFFLYEIISRIDGYSGFALQNINVLKKAEELQVMKTSL
jgi:4-hydroxyphenylpyruvate dioxygenase